MGTQRKAFRLFITIFLSFGLLVATHEGVLRPTQSIISLGMNKVK